MRDSIFYSALRAIVVTVSIVIGLALGFFFISVFIESLSKGESEAELTTVYSEEILPNAAGIRKVMSSEAPVILQIDIEGVIGLDGLTADAIRQQLLESREGDFKNNRVKAILLYVNTPGGSVFDSADILRALQDYKKKYNVPIFAFVEGFCASGGMYTALAADKIFATSTSLIGSVGVLAGSPFFNVSKLLTKFDIEALVLSVGKGKDALSPFRPWKENEDENLKNILDFYYNQFVDLVTTYRPLLSREKLTQDIGAKTFPAPLAQEMGFIDVSGASIEDALKELLTKVEITDDNYQVIRLENKHWLKALLTGHNALFTGKMEHKLSISPEFDIMMKSPFLYLYQQ